MNLSTAAEGYFVSGSFTNIISTNVSATVAQGYQSSLTTYINSLFDRENRGSRK